MQNTIEATTTQLQAVGYDILTPLLMVIFGSDGVVGSLTLAGTLALFSSFWTVFSLIAYVFAAIFLVLYIYAAVHYNEIDAHEDAKIKADEAAFARQKVGGATANRFSDMKEHVESDNPNDWKLAIIEADIILDEALKRQGYAGTSLGERLRSISPAALQSLDDAWQAHKVRNEIAHGGVDFVLTHKLARETIVRYERVFAEMGLLSNESVGHH